LHPHTFYSTLFDHAKRDEIFVIMSFAPEFDSRWQSVIEPTIREDLRLTPNRVDYNLSGDSVVHDILDGIAHARLIIADITSTPMRDVCGQVWPQRNANVMWEVGIAHVMRLPDEVLLIRSDGDPSIFDLTQFRIFSYDPTNVPAARDLLKRLLDNRLKSIDQSKAACVQRCADALDPYAAGFLLGKVPVDGREFSITTSMYNAFPVSRLFDLGTLRVSSYNVVFSRAKDQPPVDIRCRITPFGRQVTELIARRMKVWDQIFGKVGK
jgi:hypothetical protein